MPGALVRGGDPQIRGRRPESGNLRAIIQARVAAREILLAFPWSIQAAAYGRVVGFPSKVLDLYNMSVRVERRKP